MDTLHGDPHAFMSTFRPYFAKY